MPRTFKIAGICGSLRKDSVNKKLILRAQQLCSEQVKGATIEIIDWSQLPIFNADLEIDPPLSVLDFKKEITEHDAVLFAIPEYNYSIPGPLKNAIDWASRSGYGGGQVFQGKPVAIIGASPGNAGSGRAQLALRQSLIYLDMVTVNQPWIAISNAYNAFKDDGSLVNERFEQNITKALHSLVKLGKQLQTNPE